MFSLGDYRWDLPKIVCPSLLPSVETVHFNSLVRFCFLLPSLSVHAYLFKTLTTFDLLHPFKGNSKCFNIHDTLLRDDADMEG